MYGHLTIRRIALHTPIMDSYKIGPTISKGNPHKYSADHPGSIQSLANASAFHFSMESLYEQVNALYAHLPCCGICGTSLYDVKAYAAFVCVHFLCFQCASTAQTVTCPQHPSSAFLPLDYEHFDSLRLTFIAHSQSLSQGDVTCFPSLYQSFYSLMALFQPPPVLERCACGRPKPLDSPCSCGYTVKRKTRNCPTCGKHVCDCKDVRSGKDLWVCGKCRYEYNWVKTGRCSLCGDVRGS